MAASISIPKLISIFLFLLAIIVLGKELLIEKDFTFMKCSIAISLICLSLAGYYSEVFVIEFRADIQARRDRGEAIDFQWAKHAWGLIAHLLPKTPVPPESNNQN